MFPSIQNPGHRAHASGKVLSSRLTRVPCLSTIANQNGSDAYKRLVEETVQRYDDFVQLSIRAKQGSSNPWRLVTIRPVLLKQKKSMQVSWYDSKQHLCKNYDMEKVGAELDSILEKPFTSIQMMTTSEKITVQVTRGGKAIVHREARSTDQPVVRLEHDQVKAQPLPAHEPDDFLIKIGIQTQEGRVRANMQSKLVQINEFIKLLVHTGVVEQFASRGTPVHIVDCGCGAAHLTLGTYHYLASKCGLSVKLSGVDLNKKLVERSNRYCRDLGIHDAQFYTSSIIDHQPPSPVDIVIALHACDTATDEALAFAVLHNAAVVLTAPCCHKDVQEQVEEIPTGWQPLTRHGIFKQRLLDMLTDTFRAQLMRIVGYKTTIVEFVSGEHTPRNIMIRAVRLPEAERLTPREEAVCKKQLSEYQELKQAWGVEPQLEQLLGRMEGSPLA